MYLPTRMKYIKATGLVLLGAVLLLIGYGVYSSYTTLLKEIQLTKTVALRNNQNQQFVWSRMTNKWPDLLVSQSLTNGLEVVDDSTGGPASE